MFPGQQRCEAWAYTRSLVRLAAHETARRQDSCPHQRTATLAEVRRAGENGSIPFWSRIERSVASAAPLSRAAGDAQIVVYPFPELSWSSEGGGSVFHMVSKTSASNTARLTSFKLPVSPCRSSEAAGGSARNPLQAAEHVHASERLNDGAQHLPARS